MISQDPSTARKFQGGDKIVLAEGTYQGTTGIFLRYKEHDGKWADIEERNGNVRSHPLAWMRHIDPVPPMDADPLCPEIHL